MKKTTYYTAGIFTLTMVAGSVLVPTAFAEEEGAGCVTSVDQGSASWSIKKSYLNYLTLPITRGEVIVSDGVTIDNPKTGPFVFEVDADRSTIESESKGVFGLKGTIDIHGHKSGDKWELDQTLSDVKIAVDGTEGQIIMDFSSARYPNPDNLPPYSGDDAVIANVTWDSAPNLTAGDVSLSGADVKLTEVGASELFAKFYGMGQVLAPVSVSATLVEQCESPDPTTTEAPATTTTMPSTTTEMPTTTTVPGTTITMPGTTTTVPGTTTTVPGTTIAVPGTTTTMQGTTITMPGTTTTVPGTTITMPGTTTTMPGTTTTVPGTTTTMSSTTTEVPTSTTMASTTTEATVPATTSTEVTTTSVAPMTSTEQPAPTTTTNPDDSNGGGDFVSRILNGLKSLLNRLYNTNGIFGGFGIGAALAMLAGILYFFNMPLFR
ncbi:HtaA domain-containing protein [Corynebacterium sp. TAE3-ERU16]|uniref:HtaA domain-containing protein n=1 Tax=Corynebacterium sp. TAE3-ERU16 TaxID=2849493 RepID=UPI001C47AC75|nr:HtaA domain-containing protein [Corynebacterium sp. TAE3-ERU16]MBV7292620.1 HtaA domain-containing protein [Corynebacterium sp. TAE3-ERU16]